MLRSKGVLEAAAAVRRLRARGIAVELLLAGPTDPDNPDSLDDRTLARVTAEPGIAWLGRVADVRDVWRRAAIAVLPSTYGEGVPKALLEAAACARPIVATDMPGCREVTRPGETGLLVPPHDIAALAQLAPAQLFHPLNVRNESNRYQLADNRRTQISNRFEACQTLNEFRWRANPTDT